MEKDRLLEFYPSHGYHLYLLYIYIYFFIYNFFFEEDLLMFEVRKIKKNLSNSLNL